MPLPTLDSLANDAASSVLDLLDETEWEDFDAKTPLEKIQWRYCHADCDAFAEAVSAVTDWPIVAVHSASHGPVHRLVEMPDGSMVDAMGIVSKDDLCRRYGGEALSFGPGAIFSMNQDPEDLVGELQAFCHLDVAPFNTTTFQEKMRAYIAGADLDPDLFIPTEHASKAAKP
jgi:hypothetical protein